MTVYFDSSVLVSFLLEDGNAEEADALWHRHDERTSSVLFELECSMALRRVSVGQAKDVVASLQSQLRTALEEIVIKPLDKDVVQVAHDTPALTGCRSLDAVHVATALFVKNGASGDVSLCTFDKRMSEVARNAGLDVIPADALRAEKR